jgi:hypothetical protein
LERQRSTGSVETPRVCPVAYELLEADQAHVSVAVPAHRAEARGKGGLAHEPAQQEPVRSPRTQAVAGKRGAHTRIERGAAGPVSVGGDDRAGIPDQADHLGVRMDGEHLVDPKHVAGRLLTPAAPSLLARAQAAERLEVRVGRPSERAGFAAKAQPVG